MFEILTKSKITKRLDTSEKFWKQFAIYDENSRKVMRLYEDENILTTQIFVPLALTQKNTLKN